MTTFTIPINHKRVNHDIIIDVNRHLVSDERSENPTHIYAVGCLSGIRADVTLPSLLDADFDNNEIIKLIDSLPGDDPVRVYGSLDVYDLI